GGLEGVLKLEYDATFGADNGTDDKSSENTGLGADKKGIEVANAYFKNKFDSISGLSLTAGIAPYDFPLVWGDNAPLVGASYTIGENVFSVNYVKIQEGSNNKASDDSQAYIADAPFKFGNISLRPGFFLTQSKKNVDPQVYGTKDGDTSVRLFALNTNVTAGNFGFDATGVYANGKDKTTDTKYSSYAFDLAPNFKVNDSIKLTGFFTMISGDNKSDDKNNSFIDATIDGGNAGINIWRLYIIEDGGTFTTNSMTCEDPDGKPSKGKYDNIYGYTAAGLTLDATFGALTAKFQGAWVQAAKKPVGGKKDIGIEFDTNIGYGIAEGTTLYVEGAFLKAGKFYGDNKQNAYYLNVGTTYSL
ncbi:MAG TPA: hypothetical protein PKK43_08430, partial [Spirochaetota bacterium]|nr:hypothetical protein [Spirochaetota bacterium]